MKSLAAHAFNFVQGAAAVIVEPPKGKQRLETLFGCKEVAVNTPVPDKVVRPRHSKSNVSVPVVTLFWPQ